MKESVLMITSNFAQTLETFVLNVFRDILIFRINGNCTCYKRKILAEIFFELRFVVLLKTPGGELNRNDIVVARFAKQSFS